MATPWWRAHGRKECGREARRALEQTCFEEVSGPWPRSLFNQKNKIVKGNVFIQVKHIWLNSCLEGLRHRCPPDHISRSATKKNEGLWSPTKWRDHLVAKRSWSSPSKRKHQDIQVYRHKKTAIHPPPFFLSHLLLASSSTYLHPYVLSIRRAIY